MRLELVESLFALIVPPLFGGSLSLGELIFSVLLLGDILTALDDAIVVVADAVEVLFAHVEAAFFSSSHSLSELGLDLETLSLLKTLSSALGSCNSVLCGKADLLQFLALCGGLLKLFINLLESRGFLRDEEAVLELLRELFTLRGFKFDFEGAHDFLQESLLWLF